MDILTALLFLIIISSGSVFASAFFDKKYEEIVPITCTAMVGISFIFGMIGVLEISAIIILIIAIILYVISFIRIKRNNIIKEFIKNTLTPGFTLYMILCFAFIFAIYGKLFDSPDEFSHWGDVVKAMTTIDDFATNHYSRSIFKTYPPGMSLFQYVIEKLNYYITGNVFSEWQCYLGYYALSVSYLAPLTRNFSFKKPLVMFTYLVAIFFVPFTFYYGIYYQLYIDPFLSFLICAGGMELLLKNENDLCFDLRIYSILFMFVMAKDTGLLFAIILLVIYMFTKFIKKEFDFKKILLSIFSILIPKLLWNYNISINEATNNFSNKIDFANLLQVILGNDDTYRSYVFRIYFETFKIQGVRIGTIGLPINYLIFSIISLITVIIIVLLLHKKSSIKRINMRSAFIFVIASLVIFVFGLCVVYMYKFSVYEATTLASYERYLNTVYLALWLFITMIVVYLLNEINGKISTIMVIAFLCLVAPLLNIVMPYCLRATVRGSWQMREPYNEVTEKINRNVDKEDSIWIVSQDTVGYDRLIYKMCVRPAYIRNNYWILGETIEDFEEYALNIDVSEWKKMLIDEYEYVLLSEINDSFIENYSSIFEDSEKIYDNCIYKVDKETGMLIFVE